MINVDQKLQKLLVEVDVHTSMCYFGKFFTKYFLKNPKTPFLSLLQNTKRTHFAVSPFSKLPAFFTRFNSEVIVSAHSASLCPDVLTLNKPHLIEYLSGVDLPPFETCALDVHRIPPGAYLEFNTRSANLQPIDRQLLFDFEESFDHPDDFFRALENVISDYVINPNSSLGVRLSGGYDSTTVFSSLKAAGYSPKGFTIIFPDKESNESEFISSIEERQSLSIHRISADDGPGTLPRVPPLHNQILPFFDIFERYTGRLHNLANEKGIDLLFTGAYGDELSNFSGFLYDSEVYLGKKILERTTKSTPPNSFLCPKAKSLFIESGYRFFEQNELSKIDAIVPPLGWGYIMEFDLLYERSDFFSLEMLHPFLDPRLLKTVRSSSRLINHNQYPFKPLFAQYLDQQGLSRISHRNGKSDLSATLFNQSLDSIIHDMRSEDFLSFADQLQIFDLDRLKCCQDAPRSEIVRTWQALRAVQRFFTH